MMMKRENGFRKSRFLLKPAFCLMIVFMMMGLTACMTSDKEEGTKVSISKEETISIHIVESFDKSYYDKEELQQMILTEAADYNREVGAGNVSVEKIETEDGMATVEMSFASAKDYAEFQGGIFFLGSPQEAQDAGYDLNTVLSSTEDELETIGMSDMLAMTDYKLLITDMKEPVSLNGKAAYASDNVSCSKNLKTVTFGEEDSKLAYVMYR